MGACFTALLPAAIAGIDVVRLLEGMAAMERRFSEAAFEAANTAVSGKDPEPHYGLALLASLRRHAGAFRLHVLSLDEKCADILRAMALPEVRVVELAALEAADPELAATRSTRGPVEYYFTCTAAFMQHLFASEPAMERLAYVDSDLWFTAPLQFLFDDMGDASVHVLPVAAHVAGAGYAAPPGVPQPSLAGVSWLAGTGFCIHASSWRMVTK